MFTKINFWIILIIALAVAVIVTFVFLGRNFIFSPTQNIFKKESLSPRVDLGEDTKLQQVTAPSFSIQPAVPTLEEAVPTEAGEEVGFSEETNE